MNRDELLKLWDQFTSVDIDLKFKIKVCNPQKFSGITSCYSEFGFSRVSSSDLSKLMNLCKEQNCIILFYFDFPDFIKAEGFTCTNITIFSDMVEIHCNKPASLNKEIKKETKNKIFVSKIL